MTQTARIKNSILPFDGLRNARDLGGMPAADGMVVKKGKLIRSGRLHKLPEKTVAALIEMGIDNIIDLRIDREIYEHKPTILEGVTYHYFPFICTAEEDMVTVDCMMSTKMYRERKRLKREFKNADEYMKETYRLILFSPIAKQQLKKIFDLFVAEEKCILWHCNSGKDRTGIVTMLLLGALGTPREVILDDYVLSYYFLRKRRRMQRFLLASVTISI